VFQSFRHHFDTLMWYMYLQKPDLDGIDDTILRIYNHVFDALFEDRSLIPAGQYHEVAFAELEQRPMEVAAQIYDKLGVDGFERARPHLQAYLETVATYRKNDFPALAPTRREKVARAWRRTFEEWGYPM
jgi:hypothetical protein